MSRANQRRITVIEELHATVNFLRFCCELIGLSDSNGKRIMTYFVTYLQRFSNNINKQYYNLYSASVTEVLCGYNVAGINN